MYNKGIGSKYIKKEDVKDYVLQRNKYFGIVFIFMSLVPPFIIYSVIGKLQSMYFELNVDLPFISQHAVLISLAISFIIILFGIKVMFRGNMFIDQDPLFINTKAGEMIDVNKYNPVNIEIFIFIWLGLSVGFMVMAIIQPIYSLTSTI